MNVINKKQFVALWVLLAIVGAVAGFFRQDLSGPDTELQQVTRKLISMSGNQQSEIRKKASYLHQVLTGKVEVEQQQNDVLEGDKVSSAVSFKSLSQSEDGAPFISAIVSEGGTASVYIRNAEEKAQILTIGDSWGGWTIEVIEASRVYFSNDGENIDYYVFATIGNN